eukprot:1302876-Pyramimonas_sp.AAC.1
MHRSWAQDGPGQNRCMCIVLFPLSSWWRRPARAFGFEHPPGSSVGPSAPRRATHIGKCTE